MADDPGVINLGNKEIDPADEAKYRERIKQAKAGRPLSSLKASEPVGAIPRPQMPILTRQAPEEAPAATQDGVQPRPPGSPVLRPETAAQLEAALQAGKDVQAKEAEKALDETKLAEDARLAEVFDQFDFGNAAQQVERILDNKKRREAIESRCAPMNVEDLLMKDEVSQRVPILPGQFEPLFRSITPVESLYLKGRMARETINSDQYLGEKYNLMLLACSLVDINKVPLPDHRKHTQLGFEVDDKLFDAKLQTIMRKSGYVVADLGVNYIWFDIRVRRLLNPDDLKNG